MWINLDDLMRRSYDRAMVTARPGAAESILDMPDGSGSDFADHWNWAADKGLLNRNTAHSLRAAVLKVLSVEGEGWKMTDVRSIDVDRLLDRFENLFKKDFTPASLSTYRSRFKRAHTLYLSFLEDPRNYRPQARERRVSAGVQGRVAGQGDTSRGKVTEADRAAQITTAPRPAGLIRYPFPIRPGLLGELNLPADLRKEEARRLAAFLDSIAIDEGPEEQHSPSP